MHRKIRSRWQTLKPTKRCWRKITTKGDDPTCRLTTTNRRSGNIPTPSAVSATHIPVAVVQGKRQLTRQQVDAAAARRHVDVCRHLAFLQRDLQRAVVQVTEEQEAVQVPRAELEAQRYDVVSGPARQLQEAGGVKEDREGVGLHAGEGQVPLDEKK